VVRLIRKRQSVRILLWLVGIFSAISWGPLKEIIHYVSVCFWSFPLVDFHYFGLAPVLCLKVSVVAAA
jgi:hypothetical protein